MLANAHTAEQDGATPIDSLRLFVDAAIGQRNELVLPLHGGPPLISTVTVTVRTKIHGVLQRIIDRGIADRTLNPDVTPHDIIAFGAMLAQPRPTETDWDATCRRLLATYLRGIAA